jgi:heme exporter protein D
MSDFLSMGGYALFVWGSYGATALLVAAEVYLVTRRRRSLLGQLRRMLVSLRRMEQ